MSCWYTIYMKLTDIALSHKRQMWRSIHCDICLWLGHKRDGKLPMGILLGAGNGIYPDLGGGDTHMYKISEQDFSYPTCPQIPPTIAIYL